jgi:hypothetical protein
VHGDFWDNNVRFRRHFAATAPELDWALRLTDRIIELQDALASPP